MIRVTPHFALMQGTIGGLNAVSGTRVDRFSGSVHFVLLLLLDQSYNGAAFIGYVGAWNRSP